MKTKNYFLLIVGVICLLNTNTFLAQTVIQNNEDELDSVKKHALYIATRLQYYIKKIAESNYTSNGDTNSTAPWAIEYALSLFHSPESDTFETVYLLLNGKIVRNTFTSKQYFEHELPIEYPKNKYYGGRIQVTSCFSPVIHSVGLVNQGIDGYRVVVEICQIFIGDYGDDRVDYEDWTTKLVSIRFFRIEGLPYFEAKIESVRVKEVIPHKRRP